MESKKQAIAFLKVLENQPLCYGLKSPDMDLYDFGFGELIKTTGWLNVTKEMCTHILHVTCRFKIIRKNSQQPVERYYEDTPCEKFHSQIANIIGLCVKRVALSAKNDLWLDFGDYWIVFATFENGEESWRFFVSDITKPHLVASDLWLRFDS